MFLYGMSRKGRVSGMIEGVFVPDTMILAGIGDDMTDYCTGCLGRDGCRG